MKKPLTRDEILAEILHTRHAIHRADSENVAAHGKARRTQAELDDLQDRLHMLRAMRDKLP
jgi:hypothetical protein